jgi:hypothetical protein
VKRLAADRSRWKSYVAALCSSTGDDRKWWWWCITCPWVKCWMLLRKFKSERIPPLHVRTYWRNKPVRRFPKISMTQGQVFAGRVLRYPRGYISESCRCDQILYCNIWGCFEDSSPPTNLSWDINATYVTY